MAPSGGLAVFIRCVFQPKVSKGDYDPARLTLNRSEHHLAMDEGGLANRARGRSACIRL
jgi:hypothetical protein